MSLNSPVGAPGTGSELDRLGALGLPSATQVLFITYLSDIQLQKDYYQISDVLNLNSLIIIIYKGDRQI